MTVADAIMTMLEAALDSQGIVHVGGGEPVQGDVEQYVRIAPKIERNDYPTQKRGTSPLADRRLTLLVSSCVIGTRSDAETLRNKTVEAIITVADSLLSGLVSEHPEEGESEWEYSENPDKRYICIHTEWSCRYRTPRGTLESELSDIEILIDGGNF